MKRIFNGSGGRKTALILSLCLIFALAVGTTFALLKANTEPVTNTFTAAKSDIKIDEDVTGGQKKSIAVINTGTAVSYVRVKLVMNWYSAIFASIVVAFPLMYRTARGAFESFDETLAWSAQTLGQSNAWIFWRVRMPCCRQGILAGTVLTFARALGEYGATSMIAGYTPGRTATISTTVYQLWQTSNDALAMKWVMVNLSISAVVLLTVNMLERRDFLVSGGKRRGTA